MGFNTIADEFAGAIARRAETRDVLILTSNLES
jgi:hypothetical protein